MAFIVTSWWARWRLKSPASRLFAQPFVQAQTKALLHWPLWGESTRRAFIADKFPFDDVIMIFQKARRDPERFRGPFSFKMKSWLAPKHSILVGCMAYLVFVTNNTCNVFAKIRPFSEPRCSACAPMLENPTATREKMDEVRKRNGEL